MVAIVIAVAQHLPAPTPGTRRCETFNVHALVSTLDTLETNKKHTQIVQSCFKCLYHSLSFFIYLLVYHIFYDKDCTRVSVLFLGLLAGHTPMEDIWLPVTLCELDIQVIWLQSIHRTPQTQQIHRNLPFLRRFFGPFDYILFSPFCLNFTHPPTLRIFSLGSQGAPCPVGWAFHYTQSIFPRTTAQIWWLIITLPHSNVHKSICCALLGASSCQHEQILSQSKLSCKTNLCIRHVWSCIDVPFKAEFILCMPSQVDNWRLNSHSADIW